MFALRVCFVGSQFFDFSGLIMTIFLATLTKITPSPPPYFNLNYQPHYGAVRSNMATGSVDCRGWPNTKDKYELQEVIGWFIILHIGRKYTTELEKSCAACHLQGTAQQPWYRPLSARVTRKGLLSRELTWKSVAQTSMR